MDETAILIKLGKIEQDIAELKRFLLSKNEPSAVVKLGGILHTTEITEEDISQAKKSIFKVSEDL